MIAQLSYKDCIFGRTVNDAVFVIDAPRPVTGKSVFEGFRLAAAGEGIAHYLMDEKVDAFEHLSVGLLPVQVVLPRMPGKDEFHLASLRDLPPPRSSSAMDSSSLRAFFGTRRRYAVSSRAVKSSSESITTESSFCRVMMTGSWSLHAFFIACARPARAAEYVIVFIKTSNLHCTSNCTYMIMICQVKGEAVKLQNTMREE